MCWKTNVNTGHNINKSKSGQKTIINKNRNHGDNGNLNKSTTNPNTDTTDDNKSSNRTTKKKYGNEWMSED